MIKDGNPQTKIFLIIWKSNRIMRESIYTACFPLNPCIKAKLEMMKAKVAGGDTEKSMPQKVNGKEETL